MRQDEQREHRDHHTQVKHADRWDYLAQRFDDRVRQVEQQLHNAVTPEVREPRNQGTGNQHPGNGLEQDGYRTAQSFERPLLTFRQFSSLSERSLYSICHHCPERAFFKRADLQRSSLRVMSPCCEARQDASSFPLPARRYPALFGRQGAELRGSADQA